MSEQDIRTRLKQHTSNVHRQHFLYRAYKRLEPTSEGAVEALENVRCVAKYNANTVALLEKVNNPLLAKVLNLVYIEGKGVNRTAMILHWSPSWVYRMIDRGVKEIHEKL